MSIEPRFSRIAIPEAVNMSFGSLRPRVCADPRSDEVFKVLSDEVGSDSIFFGRKTFRRGARGGQHRNRSSSDYQHSTADRDKVFPNF